MKFISRLFAQSAIQIRGGIADCVKGKITKRLLDDISCVVKESNIEQGEIWIDQSGKVGFSGDIPEMFHQRLRNVISLR
jgi:hypothetical protein